MKNQYVYLSLIRSATVQSHTLHHDQTKHSTENFIQNSWAIYQKKFLMKVSQQPQKPHNGSNQI